MKKKNWLRTILSITLAVILLLGIFPATAASEEAAAQIIGEEVSLREEHVKHFQRDDGTFVAAVYAEPVHFQDDSGEWQEIDNTLQAKTVDGKTVYEPAASGLDIKIPRKFEGDQSLTIAKDGYTVGLSVSAQNEDVQLSKAAAVTAVDKLASETLKAADAAAVKEAAPKNAKERIEKANEEAMKVDDLTSAVTYKDIFPGADLEYIVEPGKVKENIVVKAAQDEYAYKFNLDIGGLIAAPQENGSIYLLENANDAEPLFVLLAPFMYDAAGAESTALSMNLAEDGTLTLVADAAWVNDDAREFPVVIDPSFTELANDFQDAYISTAYPDANYNSNFENYIGKGLLGMRRTYLKFSLPSLPTNSIVDSANLKLRQTNSDYSPGGMYLRAYKVPVGWSSSGITWNNQPSTGTLVSSVTISNSNGEYSLNITAAVASWRTSGGNYGFMLTTSNESSNGQIRVASVQHGTTSYRPSVTIVYSTPAPPPATNNNSVTITYDGNGHTGGTVPTNHSVITPGSVELKQPGNLSKTDTRNGVTRNYIFGGWKDANGIVRPAGSSVNWDTATSDTFSLTATWVLVAPAAFQNQWSATAYNQHLATFAMYLSYAAYNPVSAGLISPIAPNPYMTINDEICNVLGNYGFEDIRQFNYPNASINTAAHTIAHRKITGSNGTSRSLIVVPVRGTAADLEWLTDIVSMFDAKALGFKAASTNARTNFIGYVNDPQISPKLENPIVLITGHSLGAAVANLLADELTRTAGWGPEKICAYTFATPKVEKYTLRNYGNIFNILNRNDYVTQFPGTLRPDIINPWGRHGIDIPIAMNYTIFGEQLAANHMMSTYFNWMNARDTTLDFAGIQALSNADKRMGILPRLLSWKCPVGVTITDSEGNELAFESTSPYQSGPVPQALEPDVQLQGATNELTLGSGGELNLDSSVVSWVTEDGEKVFFIPYGSIASAADVVSNGNGTMTFRAATMDGDETYEMKTFVDIDLYTGKEFASDNIMEDVEDIQLLLVEDGDVIGEVAPDGTETLY